MLLQSCKRSKQVWGSRMESPVHVKGGYAGYMQILRKFFLLAHFRVDQLLSQYVSPLWLYTVLIMAILAHLLVLILSCFSSCLFLSTCCSHPHPVRFPFLNITHHPLPPSTSPNLSALSTIQSPHRTNPCRDQRINRSRRPRRWSRIWRWCFVGGKLFISISRRGWLNGRFEFSRGPLMEGLDLVWCFMGNFVEVG